jgi:alpha-D-ribose 1-methylphosphonate 5-triphosphate synthase subunit PhnI
MRNHRYHEPLDTHDMVLERRANSVYGDTMTYTMEKWY